jgi:WG containing repeat
MHWQPSFIAFLIASFWAIAPLANDGLPAESMTAINSGTLSQGHKHGNATGPNLTTHQPRRLLPVAKDGMWGYIARTGEMIIPPHYDNADEFYEGLAAVEVGTKYGFIDESGKIVIPPQFDDRAFWFNDGLANVRLRDKWGFIDKTGKMVIPPLYDEGGKFSEGLGCGCRRPQMGFHRPDRQAGHPVHVRSGL